MPKIGAAAHVQRTKLVQPECSVALENRYNRQLFARR
jgi:hypothetical protein